MVYFDLSSFLSLENIKLHLNEWREICNEHPLISGLIFSLIILIIVGLGLPIAIPLMLLLSALFGKWIGTFLFSISAAFGGLLTFLLSRHLFSDFAHKKLGRQLKMIESLVEKNPFWSVFGFRVTGMFPLVVINGVFGITHIPIKTFFMGSLLGGIPITFLYCQAGETLSSIRSFSDILSPKLMGTFAMIGLVILLLGWLKYRANISQRG